MSEDRHRHVYPLGRLRLPDGSDRQQIELVLTHDPDREAPSLADPVLRLDAAGARALAHELLVLAQHAEQPGPTHQPPR